MYIIKNNKNKIIKIKDIKNVFYFQVVDVQRSYLSRLMMLVN